MAVFIDNVRRHGLDWSFTPSHRANVQKFRIAASSPNYVTESIWEHEISNVTCLWSLLLLCLNLGNEIARSLIAACTHSFMTFEWDNLYLESIRFYFAIRGHHSGHQGRTSHFLQLPSSVSNSNFKLPFSHADTWSSRSSASPTPLVTPRLLFRYVLRSLPVPRGRGPGLSFWWDSIDIGLISTFERIGVQVLGL